MRIVVTSDEPYAVWEVILSDLTRRGHDVVRLGALASGADCDWARAAEEAALRVAGGEADEGIFACWTGTGISIAANKVPGIRAALCADAQTAAGARTWNHANVLCLSNRTLSPDVAREILAAWFDTVPGDRGAAGVASLAEVESRHRRV